MEAGSSVEYYCPIQTNFYQNKIEDEQAKINDYWGFIGCRRIVQQ